MTVSFMKINFKKLVLGRRYRVRFLDHSMSNDGVIVTGRVYGWLHTNSKDHISVCIFEIEDKEYREENIELANILKSAIIEIKQVD